MMKRVRRFLILTAVTVLCLNAWMAGLAEMTIRAVNTANSSATLTIGANRSATAKGSATAKNPQHSIKGTLTVERSSSSSGPWSTYQSWPSATGTGTLTISKTCTLPAGYSYRAKFVTLISGETVTKYSAVK